MSKCIYLKKTEPEVTFKEREHIIPAGIGGIAKLPKGMVSDQFNTDIFSRIELDFMRNSIIAIPRQFEGPGKRGSLCTKNATKSKIHVMSFSNDPSNVILGYTKLATPHPIPQFKIINQTRIDTILDPSEGNYNIQLSNLIEALRNFNNKYITIKDNNIPSNIMLLGNFQNKWYLGVHDDTVKPPSLEYINKIIKSIIVSKPQPKFESEQVISHQSTKFDIENFYRVCAKIVFNFLAFSNGSQFVLQNKFDPIRNWIVNGGKNKFSVLIDRGKYPKKFSLPGKVHNISIIKVNDKLLGLLSLYNHFDISVNICDNFTESYFFNGYVCDWENREEYDLFEYVEMSNNQSL
ncbi:hypothetical protein [Clostridium sp. JN-1]|uniref:hypothetical protein n=1 Tax=Clostridium sp. JN-1 TaxID=2483110 RepID=UPI000F0B21B7|nr:hypothetical protein [Clostridium sp. JN-1]